MTAVSSDAGGRDSTSALAAARARPVADPCRPAPRRRARDGRRPGVVKASRPGGRRTTVDVAGLDHYVSRAAHKLLGALDAFGVDPRGPHRPRRRRVHGRIHPGAARAGRRVASIALDVGHGQLVPRSAATRGSRSSRASNARYLTAEALRGVRDARLSSSLVVGDLSFISLTMVLPALVASWVLDADFVLLDQAAVRGRAAGRP